jgi:hypothetical protein
MASPTVQRSNLNPNEILGVIARQISGTRYGINLFDHGAEDQTTLRWRPTVDPGWTIIEEGFTLAREHELESLFAIGNGYAGSRGSLEEGSELSAIIYSDVTKTVGSAPQAGAGRVRSRCRIAAAAAVAGSPGYNALQRSAS